ncbi:MAG: hypothetical protein OEY72_11530, partial [Gammaproteobacteria bacterium]|nr:hypothetical protein [Gammaproteobacteria bacterium]
MNRIVTAFLLLLAPVAALGDWQAFRAEGGITAVHQRETNGDRQDTAVSGDLFLFLPVSSGEWMLYIEGATATSVDSLFNVYPESNADAGSAQDDDGGSRIQVSEFNYRWVINERNELTLGQIDPSAHLDRSRIANDENAHFLGASFVNNPTIEFPDYALGLMYRINRTATSPEITAILSSSDGLADNPGRSYRELIDVADAGKGIFAGLGARWAIGATRIGFGGWYRSDEHPEIGNPDSSLHNYGAYGVYGWQSGNHGVNFRAGAARATVSPAEFFIGAAYEGVTPFGAFGIGVGKIYESDPLVDLGTNDTIHAETFFRIPLLSETSHLTVALQYIENSGFDSSDATIDAHAHLAAVR